MTHIRNISVLLLFVFAFFVHSNSASAAVTKCIGQPTTLSWAATGNITNCTPSYTAGCQFTAAPIPGSGTPSISPSATCTASLSCTGPGGYTSTSDTLTVDTTKTWNGSACVPNATGAWTAPACPTVCGTAASNPSYVCTGGNGVCSGTAPTASCAATAACACTNGANNPTACTTCTAPLVWNTTSTSCVSALDVTMSSANYNATLPNSTVTATYTLANGTGATCRLLDYLNSPLTSYAACSGSMSVTAPTNSGTYGYSIQAYKASTGETKSGPFTVTIGAAPVRGVCAATHFSCTVGTSINNATGANSYTWSCAGSNGGSTADCSESFPPVVTLTGSNTTIDSGQSTMLTWSSTNATGCSSPNRFPADGATRGSVSTGPLTQTSIYQVTCTGTSGTSAPANFTVTVNQPTITTFTATPARVLTGSASIISWSASQVTSCAITRNGFAWQTGLTGTVTDPITTKTVYVLTCQTNGAPISQTVTANVAPGYKGF